MDIQAKDSGLRAEIPSISANGRRVPPSWALRQRDLRELMEKAAVQFTEHATRSDGTLIQRGAWPYMDGTDNGYEAFLSFPLFYLLGGSEQIHHLARKEFDAITRQYTRYGTVDREFVKGFDWFHHGESYTYIYYLALADPDFSLNRGRSLRFAQMYTGEDSLAPNWDAGKRMIRGPLNGSHGPRFITTNTDWSYHRPILANYLAPFEDIDLPGIDKADPLFKVDWTDDRVFEKVLDSINTRMTRNDVPLNLTAAGLVTNAYLYTGEENYKQWVLDYLGAWMERRDANGGILPDNVGPGGTVGELMDGKWWGGYYGWRWPHGARNLIEPAFVAGRCAVLMTGDLSWLDLCRSQLDLLWAQRKEVDGVTKVPARYGDQGWFDYRRPDPRPYIHLYYLTQSAEDLARLDEVFPDRCDFSGMPPDFGRAKAGMFPPQPWLAYLEGRDPAWPDRILEATFDTMCRTLDRLESDDSDPEERHCYHFQNLNPVLPEGMVQMALGTPAALYNGGLLQTHLFYYDPLRRRPGLPKEVAALVDQAGPDSVGVTLVNGDPLEGRRVWLQAGAFGEHEFTGVWMDDGGEPKHLDRKGKLFEVELGPGARVHLKLGMKRFAHKPAYASPFQSS